MKQNQFNILMALMVLAMSGLLSAQTVTFNDANLKQKVKDALNLTTDPTVTDMLGLTTLSSNGTSNPVITDLTGLETAVNLQALFLNSNQIVDLTPLSNLNNLQTLTLYSNKIHNIAPLTGLTSLQALDLKYNRLFIEAYCIDLPVIEQNNPTLVSSGNYIVDPNPYISIVNCSSEITDLFVLADLFIHQTALTCGPDPLNNNVLDCFEYDYDFNDVLDYKDFVIMTKFWLAN